VGTGLAGRSSGAAFGEKICGNFLPHSRTRAVTGEIMGHPIASGGERAAAGERRRWKIVFAAALPRRFFTGMRHFKVQRAL